MDPLDLTVLALNAGSSSLKASIYSFAGGDWPVDPAAPAWQAHASWNSPPTEAQIRILDSQRSFPITSPEDVIEPLLHSIGPMKIDMVGHRVVHGGSAFRESTLITPDVKAAIAEAGGLAPAHNRIEIQGMEAVERLLGANIPQVAVFDTAFHSSLPPAAYVYPGPYSWLAEGIRRYGFHGISHQYAATRAARLLGRDLASLRVVTCHLGNGCSLAAVRNGVCVDTTMGFTPLEGLMMGMRSGSIDPGILLHLLRHGYPVDRMEDILNHESGLLGISGVSADMREILKAIKSGNPRAQLAFDIYVHRVRFHIGALLPALGGLDALVFTAGVGENCAPIRGEVCRDMAFLGLKIDERRNESLQGEGDVSATDSKVKILVVKTQEEWQIALECLRLEVSR